MKKTLVILDNNTVDQRLYRSLSDHYNVMLFESGESFKHQMHRIRADLFLIEARLPGVDGYTVCRSIREIPQLIDVPVVFCGTKVTLDDRIKCYECGGDAHITKPFDVEILLEKLKTILVKGVRNSRRDNLDKEICDDVKAQVGQEWGWDMCTNYFRQIMACDDIDQLAAYVLDNCSQLNVTSSLMFHQANRPMHFNSHDSSDDAFDQNQAEYELLANSKSGGQLICFGRQMIFNSEHCSILLKDHDNALLQSDQLCSIMTIMTETINQKLSSLLRQAQPVYNTAPV